MAWAWAVPMAFAAEQQALPASLWLISGAIVLWTIAFDTYYAMADREEDLKIGINIALDDETIPNKQKQIRELRNKLDNRMREIYHPEDSDIYIDHRSSVYMSLAWTAIATSVLYYLFHILSKE